MAFVITDAQGNIAPTAPPPNPNNDPYFKETRTFPSGIIMPGGQINPGLLQMLAGIGAEMDPRGAGGIIGRAGINYSQMMAAEKAYNEQVAETRANNKKLFDVLSSWGDMSPKGKAGPTSVQANPDGSFTVKGNTVDQEITQENMPLADQQTNRQMPGMEPDMPAGRLITNEDPGRVGKYRGPTQGVTPTPQMYAPTTPIPPVPVPRNVPGMTPMDLPPRPGGVPYDIGAALSTGVERTPTGDPITLARFRQAPLPSAIPKETLDAIPVGPVPPRAPGTNRIKPGPLYTPGTEDEPEPIPKITTTAPRAGNVPIGTRPQAVTVAPQPLPQRPVVAPVQAPVDNPPLVSGGTPSTAANPAPLLPTPRRRSQTMFDLRDFIPF
jgi:hypothetical protein